MVLTYRFIARRISALRLRSFSAAIFSIFVRKVSGHRKVM